MNSCYIHVGVCTCCAHKVMDTHSSTYSIGMHIQVCSHICAHRHTYIHMCMYPHVPHIQLAKDLFSTSPEPAETIKRAGEQAAGAGTEAELKQI